MGLIVHPLEIIRTLSKRERQRQHWEARKIKHIFTLVILYVSIFAEIPLTLASTSERNDGR